MSQVNQNHESIGHMIIFSWWSIKVELIEDFPCNIEEELKNRKKEIYDKLSENKNNIYIYI